ncbi:MAG TPA: DNA polymerase III subunit epsilon [Anaerolineales bacterium]|nr:DNA polymerase III subunit epsilon [Anaerolineales bacterium]
MPTLVAFDLETTGLSSETDSIIEIGAVRFNETRVEDEFSMLINPGKRIPKFITDLTGISNEMVRGAPNIHDVLGEFEAFVGDAPVIGHNIRFDLSFVQPYNLLRFNTVIDTYELAAVLLPSAGRYKLGALSNFLGIPLANAHRALDDAKATMGIFSQLYGMAENLPFDLIAEIVRQGEPLDWDANWVFQQILQKRAKNGERPKGTSDQIFKMRDTKKYAPLQPVDFENSVKLDPEEASSVLEHGGAFSNYFEHYEYRNEQVEMLQVVADAFSNSRHLMIEAGTGVGKSFAYLVPAAMWAIQNNTRVVISTNTINLQDQLIKKDIPDLAEALGMDLRASVMKGRGNYLCPRLFGILRRRGPRDVEEMRVLTKILIWLLENQSGDRAEINLNGPKERAVWQRVSAEDDNCTTETCMKHTGGSCPFHQAKQASQSAHILIVNHALLLADIASGSHVLPEYDYLVVDEAHHLENATTSALSFRITPSMMNRLMREIGGTKSGTLGALLTEASQNLRPSDQALLRKKVKRATDLAFRVQEQVRVFFNTIGEFTEYQRSGKGNPNYAWQERIVPSTRTLPIWEDVEETWEGTHASLQLLLNLLKELYQASAELYADGAETLEDAMGSLSNAARRLAEVEKNLDGMMMSPEQGTVYWVEIHPQYNKLTLRAAPLHVGELIKKHIWHKKESVILTSATLTTHGTFDYMRNALGAADAEELALGSPFDYENSTLLFIPTDIPEPNQQGFVETMAQSISTLATATGGRLLSLFTSYAQLKQVSRAIAPALKREGIIVYEQGGGASPNSLLESFKETDAAVLLGTRSFWEGVDIPGDDLSVVAIAKIPFGVPSDPLIAARSELYENAFHEYYLPEAILQFRQGFGRLIRSAQDRGVVVIFDRRVQTKQYGRLFIESLPQCTTKVAPLRELAEVAEAWVGV